MSLRLAADRLFLRRFGVMSTLRPTDRRSSGEADRPPEYLRLIAFRRTVSTASDGIEGYLPAPGPGIECAPRVAGGPF
jgi:hypothetical protein